MNWTMSSVARAHQHGIPQLVGGPHRLVAREHGRALRPRDVQAFEQRVEALPVLGRVNV